jgi:hypothetical protein
LPGGDQILKASQQAASTVGSGNISELGPQATAYQKARGDAIAKSEQTMYDQYDPRQIAETQLQTVENIMQTYQPGAYAENKADIVRKMKAVGIPVDQVASNLGLNLKTADAAQFQEFFKDATKLVFNDVKNQGGRLLLATISGMTKSNVNPDMEPDAAAAILSQTLGLARWEDAKYRAYNEAKTQPGFDPLTFIDQWTSQNPPQTFVDHETKNFAYLGQTVPETAQRVPGQKYMYQGKPRVWVTRPNGEQGWAQPRTQ